MTTSAATYTDWGTCPGTHTFWRFVPEEATHG